MTVQIGTNTAFKATLYHARGIANGTASGDVTTHIPCGDTNTNVLSTSGSGVSGTITLYAPTATIPIVTGQTFFLQASSISTIANVGGVWNNGGTGGTVTGVSIQFSSGTILTGKVKVYGRS